MSFRSWFIVLMLMLASLTARSAPDTIRIDNGVFGSTNPAREGWEESVIISPNRPCAIIGVMIYYGAGTGKDEVRITGDASEGTIPPTQYCFPYNTLGSATADVTASGWKTIMFTVQGIRIDGNERIVVQHVMSANGPRWGQDNNAQNPTTSYVYDPVTPNPNFYNIPGIYYLAKGDYMVRLIIDDTPAYRKPPTWVDVTFDAGLPSGSAALKSDQLSVVDWNGNGFWSTGATFVTTGTTSVQDIDQQKCTITTIEIFDLRGKLLAKGPVEQRLSILEGLPGAVLVCKRNELGQPCGSELVVR